MVGFLTFPLSLAADRWGRVRSLALMAMLWSLATLFCAVAASYTQMLVGRVMVGVGEAAYGSVGIAVVISVFPQRMRATLSAAFMAGGLFIMAVSGVAGGERPRVVLEVGPGKVLSNLAKREYPEVTFLAVGTADELDNALDTVRGLLA